MQYSFCWNGFVCKWVLAEAMALLEGMLCTGSLTWYRADLAPQQLVGLSCAIPILG